MTERQISNRVKKMQDLELQLKELEAQISAIKTEIQTEMGEAEHLPACDYIVNWVKVVSNRFDSTRLKKELPDIYATYLKESSSRRFTISKA